MVTMNDFRKFEIVTARVIEARDHPDADKLYIIRIDCGDGERQIVAGVKRFYSKEELSGKDIIVLKNLEPATIRGVRSEGMLLAASGEGVVVLLTPDRRMRPGSPVS